MSKKAIVETLFNIDQYEAEQQWDNDCYETPDGTGGSVKLAQAIASLVSVPGDRLLECSAGSGRIAQFLPAGTTCMEINPQRVAKGVVRAPHCNWIQGDFLRAEFPHKFDAIVTNPPFSTASKFIEQGLKLLDEDNPESRLIYLLPTDFFQSCGRNESFQVLDAHIYREYKIVNRVAYLRGGKAYGSRQLYDSVFDIRRGRNEKTGVVFIGQKHA